MRHFALEGALNLRDIGGYPSSLGGTVRSGCLFRSDELHTLTDADLDVVSGLGVRVLFDLRNDVERTQRPNRVWDGVEVHERETPPNDHAAASLTLEEQIAQGQLPKPDDDEFGGVYVALLTYLAPELRRVVELATTAHARPLLFHCAAGKDRTGLASAVLLGLLCVDDETILDDYERTTEYFTPRRFAALAEIVAGSTTPPDHVRAHLSARRPVLARALSYIHAEWGGYETYAVNALGVAPDLPNTLRANLLA